MYRPPRAYTAEILASLGLAVLVCVSVGGWVRQDRQVREGRRRAGMREVIARAEPLLAAIQSYEKRHGKPPENLGDLKIPVLSAGPLAEQRMDTVRGWDYRPSSNGTERWALLVWVRRDQTPNLGFGDCFAYHADQRYPEHLYGGVLERVGKWGYYWE